MFKVIKAELKKTVSKPGIYILALFLAVILVLGVFIYRPDVRKYDITPITIEVGNFEANGGYKQKSDLLIDKTIDAVNSYFIKDENDNNISYYKKMYGDNGKGGLWDKYQKLCKDMQIKYSTEPALVDQFVELLKEINSTIVSCIENSKELAQLTIVSVTDYDSYTKLYRSLVISKNDDGVFGRDNESLPLADKIAKHKDKYQEDYENLISKFKFPILTESLVKNFTEETKGTSLFKIKESLKLISNKISAIEEEYNNTPASETKNRDKLYSEYNHNVNLYRGNAITYYNLVKYELMSNAFSFVNTSESLNLMRLSNESEYNSKTQLIKYRYLFENGKIDSDFSNPLAIGSTITNKVTAFDYTFFILKLFSFIIIAYAIMSACGAVAGEIKEGSMRYYAIRPISRANILFGKLISIVLMSTIILVFSTIISMCVGAGVYGWTNLTILTIFNGSTAMTIHPIAMIALFVLSFIIELLVYASIALLLSCLLKSDLLASTIMLLIYLLNLILPVFAGGMNSWLAFYPFSHINLFALFGSSIVTTGNDMLSSLLRVHTYASTSLPPMIIITTILIVLPIIFANLIFKKKEL